MTSAWNRMFGIDPTVTIRDEDRKSIDEMIGDDPRNRLHTQPNLRTQLIAYLPMMGVFIAGIVAVEFLGCPLWTMAVFFVGAVICFAYGSQWVARAHYGTMVRRALVDRGYQICVHCGYWLRGLDDVKTCPECGKAVKP